jgi:arsenate reductase
MAEVGIEISSHTAKAVDSVPLERVGCVITLCAEEVCPLVAEDVERLHWPLPDPARGGPPKAELSRFRETRDELERRLRAFFKAS